jgi:hypothetical protein
MDFEDLITEQYEAANTFADAAVVLAYPLIIFHWTKGAVEHFGYTETEAIGKDLGILFPEIGLVRDLVESEYARHLDSRSRGVSTHGRRIGHGALLEVLTSAGKTVKARCSIYPLLDEEKLYLLLFFGVEANKTALDIKKTTTDTASPFSPSDTNPFVFGAKWVLIIWQTQPILFFLLVFIGAAGLGVWRIESIGKAWKDIKPTSEKPSSGDTPLKDLKDLPLPPGCKASGEISVICE